MSMHPTITAALSEQRRRDLTARAETYRMARAARAASPAPARPVRVIILHLIVAVQRPVTRLFRLKTPAPAGAGSQS